jgi:hypothetical protein
MDKKIRLELNEYDPIPPSLRDPTSVDKSRAEVNVDLAQLYHHYYLDTYGRVPPSPDATQFEHVRFLMPDASFRFVGKGLGASTSARRSRSTELGQAFCRWFLHDHLRITYFAHISELLDRQEARGIAGCKVERTTAGDTPDYLCAQDASGVYLGEAKGRYSSISFKTKDFEDWRNQFKRVRVLDAAGVPRTVKGHIVATRFATEVDSSRIQSKLFAEDPQTEGDAPLDERAARALASVTIGIHYSHIAEKLNQRLLAAALWNGIPLPKEILVPVTLWRLELDPVKTRLFVGGYYPGPTGGSALTIHDGNLSRASNDPFRLDQGTGTFVGVEAHLFRGLVAACRSGGNIGTQLPRFETGERIYSGISILRDGSILGPIEFFTPVSQETL